MTDVSTFRLYLLRATYVLFAVGLGSSIWPGIIHHTKPWDLMHGVAICLMAALSALWVLGIRFPLKMLPLFFFELAWKTIWLIAIALPLWSAHQMDADTLETVPTGTSAGAARERRPHHHWIAGDGLPHREGNGLRRDSIGDDDQ